MRLLQRLERRLGRFAVPNVTAALIIAQVAIYLLTLAPRDPADPPAIMPLLLIPQLVMQGEVWRLITFLAVPPITNPIFAFFFWYVFFLMGTALENQWGVFRYNVFLLVGYLATVGAAFVFPGRPATNGFLEGSVFLAFATLYPNFEFYLFFILPVKIRWLAMLAWIVYFFVLAFGSWPDRVSATAALVNYFLFFGRDVVDRIRTGRRRMAFQSQALAAGKREYFHRCEVCGITDRTHPEMDFRYCSRCSGSRAYCSEHLKNHEHVSAVEAGEQRG